MIKYYGLLESGSNIQIALFEWDETASGSITTVFTPPSGTYLAEVPSGSEFTSSLSYDNIVNVGEYQGVFSGSLYAQTFFLNNQKFEKLFVSDTTGIFKYSSNTGSIESPFEHYFKFDVVATGSINTWNTVSPTKLLINESPIGNGPGDFINFNKFLYNTIKKAKKCNSITLTYKSGSDVATKEFQILNGAHYKRSFIAGQLAEYQSLGWGDDSYDLSSTDLLGRFDNLPVNADLEDGFFDLTVKQITSSANVAIFNDYEFSASFSSIGEDNDSNPFTIIVTGSREVTTPCWGRKITVYAIGAGGGGGGGVAANDDAHIAVGGAGGSGGTIAEYTINVTGSITLSCLIGKIGTGGSGSKTLWTGSITNNLPASAAEMINRKGWGFMEFPWGGSSGDNLVVASRGNNGGDTIVLWTGNPSSNSNYPWQLVAKGGRGGEGGFGLSVGLNDTNAERPIALGAFSPTVFNSNTFGEKTFMAIPGGTPVYTDELWADLPGKPTVYDGGPGGHGISVPFKHYKNVTDWLTTSSNYVTSSGNDNSAPDLPWGSTNDSATGPKAHPIGVLGFPFGSNVDSDRITGYMNYGGPQHAFQKALNFDKPSNVATTGGGGGLGEIFKQEYINTASIQIGTGGTQFAGNTINGVVTAGKGGNGGNLLMLDSLSIIAPNSGSLYGGGGGGGASQINSAANLTPEFAGANGASGAVIILVEP